MSNILEEDNKNSTKDLKDITIENFEKFSRNEDYLFLSVGDNDDENNIVVDCKIDEKDERTKLMRMIKRLIFLKQWHETRYFKEVYFRLY